MPAYRVLVTRDVTQSTTVRVDADTPEEAEREAVRLARHEPQEYDWEVDDNLWDSVYVGDPGNSAQEV